MTLRQSPYAAASALAKRLLAIGINPFQSEVERYVVLIGGGAGEILDWGRPLRGTRFFGPNAIRKDRPMVADFEAFAKQDGLCDCVFWCIGLTGAKAHPDRLDKALKGFNDRINIEFSELRKSGKFEVLLLVIHPRYDDVSGLFDLHAHFIARVPKEHREAVANRLRLKFSKHDFSNSPIRKAGAVATYMLWGVFRNKAMIQWPDHALQAAWKLTEGRFKFVRAGGAFAQWRASKSPLREKTGQRVDDDKKRRNRAETTDSRQRVTNGDRLLSKIVMTIRGVRVPALLFETAPSMVPARGQPAREYSSAANVVSQGEALGVGPTIPLELARPPSHRIANGLRRACSWTRALTLSWKRKIERTGKTLLKHLLC